MLVILDCDGVLVDSERLSCAALREALADLGVALTLEETMAEFLGRSRRHMLARSEQLLGAPLPVGWAADYDARRDAAFARDLVAVPGVAEAVDTVEAAGHATCVASSGDHAKMRLTLGMTGLYARFEGRIFSATEVGRGKPAPDLFLHAAERSGFAAADCVVVEDSPAGVAAARAAGMRVLGYRVDADVGFDAMAELPALIGGEAASQVQVRQVDPAGADAQRCLRAYVAELNRRAPDRGFDPSRGATADPHEVRPPRGAFVVAYRGGEAIGCGAVKHHPGAVTDVKRMWLAESARGLGLGRRLLGHLEDLARAHGSREVRLETSDVLSEAIALYRSAGYVEVAPFNAEPFADRWFAKPLR